MTKGAKTQPNLNCRVPPDLRRSRFWHFGRLILLHIARMLVNLHDQASGGSMNQFSTPWQLLLVALSGWVNQRQQQIIEFQNAQIEALLKKLGGKRILLTDD